MTPLPVHYVVNPCGEKPRKPQLRDKIYRIPVHIMGGEDLYLAYCGYKMFQGGGGIDEYVGGLVNCEDVVQMRNDQEADAGLWVYYRACQPCMDEQLNRLGQDYWSPDAVEKRELNKALRDLASTDL